MMMRQIAASILVFLLAAQAQQAPQTANNGVVKFSITQQLVIETVTT